MNSQSRVRVANRRKLDCDVEVRVAKSIGEIESIRSIWRRMQAEEPYPMIETDIDRYISVVKAIGRDVQPYVVLFGCDGRSEAMVIGRIEKRRLRIRFGYKSLFRPMLRCLTVVHGGIIGRLDGDLNGLVVRELMKVLRRGEADMIFLLHLRTNCEFYRIARTVPGFLCVNHHPAVGLHWQTRLPDTAEEFYAGMSPTRKRNLKRYSRKLEQADP